MSNLRPSQKPTREGPLLVLAVALVLFICIPLYQWSNAQSDGKQPTFLFTTERITKMLLGPEKIACYCAFAWGAFILLSRYLEVRRQRKSFGLDLLPTEEGARILPEDARPLQRKLDQVSQGKPFILSNMIRLALSRYAINRSAADVNETVRTQADVEMGRMVSSMAMVHYLAWAIPAIGFLGTVRGLGMSMQDPNAAIDNLYYAFDTTLIALVVSLPLMFLLHTVQRDEEGLVLDCQQYCLEHLVARLYDPEPVHSGERGQS
jgi:biopolymer transport protein ExbB/TolQ